jgi:hypothetical protein
MPSGWKDVQLVVDATAPAAPTNPTLSVVSSSQINVSWTASSSSDVSRYRIFRGTTGTPALVATVYDWPYQDTGLTAGTTYTYQIAAVDAGGNESPKTAPQTATTQSGIPFGIWNLDLNSVTPGPWTGGVGCCKDPALTLQQLSDAQAHGIRMWITPVGYTDANNASGDLDTTRWKSEFDKHAPFTQYQPYITDANKTLQGMILLDDITRPRWSVSFADIEAIAAYAEARIAVPTAVRAQAEFMPAGSYVRLDLAWNQYNAATRGEVTAYRGREVTAAANRSLGAIFGLNIINGGLDKHHRPPGDPCWAGNDSADSLECNMSPTELNTYGAALVPYSDNCAFMMWREDSVYLNRTGVLPAMENLASMARSHPTVSCVH